MNLIKFYTSICFILGGLIWGWVSFYSQEISDVGYDEKENPMAVLKNKDSPKAAHLRESLKRVVAHSRGEKGPAEVKETAPVEVEEIYDRQNMEHLASLLSEKIQMQEQDMELMESWKEGQAPPIDFNSYKELVLNIMEDDPDKGIAYMKTSLEVENLFPSPEERDILIEQILDSEGLNESSKAIARKEFNDILTRKRDPSSMEAGEITDENILRQLKSQ